MTKDRLPPHLLSLILFVPLASCGIISETGPLRGKIEDHNQTYTLIPVNSRADLPGPLRSTSIGTVPPPVKGGGYSDKVRSRDSLQFIFTDISAQSPFANKGGDIGPIEVPEDGNVSIPYVGTIHITNLSLAEVSTLLNEKLKPISSTALSTVLRNGRIARTANVIGSVKSPGAVPLERSDISSIDLLAATGGPTDTEHLVKYTLRRDNHDYVFDYKTFRQKPFAVEEGDLLSVTPDSSQRFYLMGAVVKPMAVPFPIPEPTLADALGAAAGLDEQRSDPSGVFIFRKGNPDLVYTINLKEPTAVHLTQRFAMQREDIVYITEAPLTRWNRLISQIVPTSQAYSNFARLAPTSTR